MNAITKRVVIASLVSSWTIGFIVYAILWVDKTKLETAEPLWPILSVLIIVGSVVGTLGVFASEWGCPVRLFFAAKLSCLGRIGCMVGVHHPLDIKETAARHCGVDYYNSICIRCHKIEETADEIRKYQQTIVRKTEDMERAAKEAYVQKTNQDNVNKILVIQLSNNKPPECQEP